MDSFKRKDELYTIDWSKPIVKRIGEFIPRDEQPSKLRTVKLPTPPPEYEMVNYGLPKEKQKFVRRPVPKDIKYWDPKDIRDYVDAEWHRRKHGYWVLIRGEAYYITGAADVYFNYWTAQIGTIPEFRFTQLEWWWEWFDVENDPECFGKLDIKCRRIGDTELALAAVWERTTRYSDSDSGVLHLDEKAAIKNLNRLSKGSDDMPFFFKPTRAGSTEAVGGKIVYAVPGEIITNKRVKEGYFDDPDRVKGLRTSIYVEPAKTLSFDGVQLRCEYIDEAFKHLHNSKFNVLDHWENSKKVMSLHNEELIVGKAIITSTIEEVDDGRALEAAQKMVDDATEIKPDGRSINGLRVVFRGYHYGCKSDEWGFPKVAEAKKKRDADVQFLREKKKYRELTHLYRKMPATLEEALSAIAGDCIFYPEMCTDRLKQLESGIGMDGKPQKKLGEFGSLVWKNGIWGGEVEWRPNDAGKWFITQHPKNPNAKIPRGGKNYPGNMAKYRMGCDPYDARVVQGQGSDGAFTVKRLLDLNDEPNEIILDSKGGVTNPWDLMTGQPVCDYRGREENPHDFYDHVYRTCVYYGVAVYPEMNKPGLEAWMDAKGLGYYVQVRSPQLVAVSSRANRNDLKGSDNTVKNIAQWTDLVQMDTYSYIWCNRHPRLIKDLKVFTVKDRTKRDLSTAWGHTHLAEMDTRYVEKKEEREQRWEESLFDRVYLDGEYNYN